MTKRVSTLTPTVQEEYRVYLGDQIASLRRTLTATECIDQYFGGYDFSVRGYVAVGGRRMDDIYAKGKVLEDNDRAMMFLREQIEQLRQIESCVCGCIDSGTSGDSTDMASVHSWAEFKIPKSCKERVDRAIDAASVAPSSYPAYTTMYWIMDHFMCLWQNAEIEKRFKVVDIDPRRFHFHLQITPNLKIRVASDFETSIFSETVNLVLVGPTEEVARAAIPLWDKHNSRYSDPMCHLIWLRTKKFVRAVNWAQAVEYVRFIVNHIDHFDPSFSESV